MKLNIIRCFSAVVAIAMFLTSVIGQSVFAVTAEAENVSSAEDSNAFEGVLENEHFKLSFNADSADIALLDKATGYVWYSNSQQNKSAKEQIVVHYFSDNKLQTMDSYVNCVSFEDQMSWSIQGGKLNVSYYIASESFSIDILPKVLTRQRMEEDILPHLSQDEQKKILKRYKLYERKSLDPKTIESIKLDYPSITRNDLYILGKIPAYIGEEIYQLFLKADYTAEDLDEDCKANGIENSYKEKPFFRIGLVYCLTDDGFSVSVNTEEIEYSTNYKPFRIDLLPHFGSCGTDENGYIFVPDGCGGIINFNNGKSDVEQYEKPFFADDSALSKNETKPSSSLSVLPVFSLVNKDSGFMATIDEGYESGGIKAGVSDNNGRDNYVYSYYDLFPSDTVSLSGNNLDMFILSSNKIFSSPITVSYHITKGNASYTELASEYREYLIKNEIIGQKNVDNSELNIEFIASALTTKKFLGIPYKNLSPLTTYNQAREIAEEFSKYKLDITFSNALEGGKNQKNADSLKTLGILGSSKDWKKLVESADNVSLSYFAQYASELNKKNSALTLNKNRAGLYNYNLVSRYIMSQNTLYLVSPLRLKDFSSGVTRSIDSKGIESVKILDLGYRLNSDFNVSDTVDRYQSRIYSQDYLKTLSEKVNLKVEKGSIYSLPYAEKITNIPTTSSGYLILDETVPFYQIAISGYVAYVTEPINTASDPRDQFLRTVELGGQLAYTWVYALPDNITDNSEEYFDCLYANSSSQAKEFADAYASLYSKIYNSSIIGHIKINDTLSKTVWDNGTCVYVNYDNEDIEIDGVTVKSKNFTALKGEE